MSGDERARLFVALELTEDVRNALADWRMRVLDDVPGLRFPSAEHLHVTLCFIGWTPVADIDAVVEACGMVATTPAAELRVSRAIWLPRRRPRVIAVELEDAPGALARVQAALSDTLHAGGWYVAEARPFLAHVTVARVGARHRLRAQELEPPPPLTMLGSRVTLFRSRLSSAGARYDPLGTAQLAQPSPTVSPSK